MVSLKILLFYTLNSKIIFETSFYSQNKTDIFINLKILQNFGLLSLIQNYNFLKSQQNLFSIQYLLYLFFYFNPLAHNSDYSMSYS